MKANISQQGLNLADLLDHTMSSTSMMTPIFNATSETNAFYEVTEPILFVINATQNPLDMEKYADSSTTTFTISTTTESITTTNTDAQCFQVMVDCSSLVIETTESSTTSSSSSTTTSSTTTTFVASEEIIYDEDYDTVSRLKRQIEERLDSLTTASPASLVKTTPQSIGRLLDSLNSILRGLKRNTTRSPSSITDQFFTTQTTTTDPPTTDRKDPTTSMLPSTPESLEDLMRWHTAGLILTTEEDEVVDDHSDVSSSIFDVLGFNQTDPSMDASESPDTTSLPVVMCPLVVCPWNDTVGFFSSLTTNLPTSDEDTNSTSSCRGDNPQGCTPFWTSSRDETITSFHSSSQYSTQPIGPIGIEFSIRIFWSNKKIFKEFLVGKNSLCPFSGFPFGRTDFIRFVRA